jgi:CMP-N,N'-diacetyllegionaminic acid synthase
MADKAMRLLHLLVGRGGSKGVPRKNLQEIAGLSLVGYKALAARRSRAFGRLIVSSDDADIRNEAARFGAEVLFERPAELATDTAGSAEVVLHAMDWIEEHEHQAYDAIMLLEPSSPFATPEHLDSAVRLFQSHNADLVVGLRETEVSTVFIGPLGDNGSIASIVGQMLNAQGLRRQDQPVEVTMNGAFYLIRWTTLRATGRIYANPESTYGILMDRVHSTEIETPLDLSFARLVAEQGLVDLSPWRGRDAN